MKFFKKVKKPVDDGEPFVEVSPTGRFGRYQEVIGSGSTKKVYKAFDQEEGKEVAWNQVCLRNFIDNDFIIKQLYNEVRLLETLKQDNILKLFTSWTDYKNLTLNFITEVCISGNLREYRRKHRHVSMMAIKKWSKQILKGLEYLHNQEPCIIHRDLNCSNIFINGNTGNIKIGDLGFATTGNLAHAVIGTPEFMAPELFKEEYTEAVDVYSFGMCVLELVTMELPYMECDSVVKIYKKVSCGVMPKALNKVKDSEVKEFIEKCLLEQSKRPSASELLKDRFFQGIDDDNS